MLVLLYETDLIEISRYCYQLPARLGKKSYSFFPAKCSGRASQVSRATLVCESLVGFHILKSITNTRMHDPAIV